MENKQPELIMKREQPFYIVMAHDGELPKAQQVWRGGLCSTPSQAWADAISKYGLAVGALLNDYHTMARAAQDKRSDHYLYPKRVCFSIGDEKLVLTMHEIKAEASS